MSKLLDRVAATEKGLEEAIKAIQAIVRVVGVSEVQAELASAAQADMKARVENGLKEGKIAKADIVGETSFIVGHELDREGKVAYPGRFQVGIQAMSDETRALFVGRKPGDEIEVPNGTIAIDEAYDVAQAN